ncbi:chloride channel protein [Crenobacter caeni]|uniref:Chloride channel protein n=1 Tax=Crenobacter caeni TaxID=2705474 RepID=A0A6B2KVG5_9NEIS|nr:chloride channel protein [Crenobacter caeni]NDV14236.1 chloride channel protein [Crenobacter caeni]
MSPPSAIVATSRRVSRRMGFLFLTLRLWRRRLELWVAAILIGLVAVVFSLGGHALHELFFRVYEHSPHWALLITPLGLALSVYLSRHVLVGAGGGGIPQSIAALEADASLLRERFLTLKVAVGKTFLTLLGIGSGATFGYEGPIVQIGAAIKYRLGIRGIGAGGYGRGLILAGSAAGVAAAFNAPLAGIVFAIEEMGRTFNQKASSTILLSVIIAGLTAYAFLGNYSYFGTASVSIHYLRGWTAILATGLAGGVAGGLTARAVLAMSGALPGPLEKFRRGMPILFAAACGLAIAVIGIANDGVTFGTGYFRARDIIEGHTEGLENYGLLKLATLLLSYLSGATGGIFAPALSVGAGIGLNVAAWLPSQPETAVVLLGMVAFFAGMTRAPVTGFVIVMEMTDSSTMLIPLMASALIAAAVSRLFNRHSLYDAQARILLRTLRAARTPAN